MLLKVREGDKIQKILGFVSARNENTLLTLTVSHALMNGCSEVCILVHNSNQDFKDEVLLLAKLWPNKIHIFYQEEFKFHQASAVHAIRFLLQNQNYDWIYVFDADEFMVQSENFNICDFLESVPSEIQSVRYELSNWVSHYDFELKHYERFLDVIHVSEPQFNSYPNIGVLKEKIKNSEVTFFDLPFPSKIIFRANAPYRLTAGAHHLEGLPENVEMSIDSKLFQIAHLPFLTKLRLTLRVQHGENAVLSKYPEGHAWQEQMLFELDGANGLDNFWASHSISISEKKLVSEKPLARVNFAFRSAIEPTINVLKKLTLSTIHAEISPSKISDVSSLVNFCEFIFKFNLGYEIVNERDHAIVERDHAIVERDHAIIERDHIQKSTVWKLFKPYRLLRSKLTVFR